MRISPALLFLSLLAGCASYVTHELDRQYGPADPARYDQPERSKPAISYSHDVRPILDRRCAVCHGCYDAPCQLDLGSWDGVARGASKDRVYDETRVVADSPTRLFMDAHSNNDWRERKFFPVLNERQSGIEANRAGSVLYRMLMLKQAHGEPEGPILPESKYDLSMDAAQVCPTIEQMDRFEQDFPAWGMPYGLPALNDRERSTLLHWIDAGAPQGEGPAPLTRLELEQLRDWEHFLNQDSFKAQLMSRYLFEHLFLANLYFDNRHNNRYFHLVRSRTPPGKPIELIATRRPYDKPGVKRVYYRLQAQHATILAKKHLPYALNSARMARYEELFLRPDYVVTALPSYHRHVTANPFVVFQAIPTYSRYRFLLDEAQFFIMAFIKGPVCRGQVAVNVINDQFWVMFVAPEVERMTGAEEFLASQTRFLRLPAGKGSNSLALGPWLKFSKLQQEFLENKSRFLNRVLREKQPITLDLVWDGNGHNTNAALTIFRHFDNASVVRGFVGPPPKTAWLINYSLFERLHYLLVAGFDVYGNAGHQLNTRLYMDFLRMEGEFQFLGLLPRATRIRERDLWYRDADEVKDFIQGKHINVQVDTSIPYKTADHKLELYGLLKRRLRGVLDSQHSLVREPDRTLRSALTGLEHLQGGPVSIMPEVAFLSVYTGSGGASTAKHFSILRNSAHLNISHLFHEEDRRTPVEDRLIVVSGFIGAYPNAFYRVQRDQLPAFLGMVKHLASEEDYSDLMNRFGVRRTDPGFWTHSDDLHDAYARLDPLFAGLFDYSRLENR